MALLRLSCLFTLAVAVFPYIIQHNCYLGGAHVIFPHTFSTLGPDLQPLDSTMFIEPLNTCGCSRGEMVITPVEQQKPAPEFTDEVLLDARALRWCACVAHVLY